MKHAAEIDTNFSRVCQRLYRNISSKYHVATVQRRPTCSYRSWLTQSYFIVPTRRPDSPTQPLPHIPVVAQLLNLSATYPPCRPTGRASCAIDDRVTFWETANTASIRRLFYPWSYNIVAPWFYRWALVCSGETGSFPPLECWKLILSSISPSRNAQKHTDFNVKIEKKLLWGIATNPWTVEGLYSVPAYTLPIGTAALRVSLDRDLRSSIVSNSCPSAKFSAGAHGSTSHCCDIVWHGHAANSGCIAGMRRDQYNSANYNRRIKEIPRASQHINNRLGLPGSLTKLRHAPTHWPHRHLTPSHILHSSPPHDDVTNFHFYARFHLYTDGTESGWSRTTIVMRR